MHSAIERQHVIRSLLNSACKFDIIQEIEGIMKPHLPSLQLEVEYVQSFHDDRDLIKFRWTWKNHVTFDTPINAAETIFDQITKSRSPSLSRVYRDGKVLFHIDITDALRSNDPYWACTICVASFLDLHKQDFVESMTNQAILGKEG